MPCRHTTNHALCCLQHLDCICKRCLPNCLPAWVSCNNVPCLLSLCSLISACLCLPIWRRVGKDRSMLIPNVLFRCNGSAVLLTNKSAHVRRAKYTIPHIVRTNLASNDVAFNCVMQTEDAERKLGVRLNKDLIKVGGWGETRPVVHT